MQTYKINKILKFYKLKNFRIYLTINEIQKLLSNRAHNVKLWDFKASGPFMNLTWNDDSIPKIP